MQNVLVITGDGAGPEAEYGVFRMREEGLRVTVAAPKKKMLFSVFHQQEPGWDHGIERAWYPLRADSAFEDIEPGEYDGLLLPGGRAPVYLRNFSRCLELIRHFTDTGKPISAICRGAILLVSTGMTGKRMTGHPLIRPRLEIGGCTYVETQGAVREGNLVTVSGRPHQHIWIRDFLSLLREHGRSV